MSRIILLDDEPNVLKSLKRVLSSPGIEVETFTEPEMALKYAQTHSCELAISDYRMPAMDGVTFLVRLKELQPDIMRIILSAYSDLNAILAAINEAEIYRFITKPWDDYDLRNTVERALTQRAVLIENRRLAEQVRRQQTQISRQEAALRELEEKHPDIAKVVWQPDGSIYLDDTDVE